LQLLAEPFVVGEDQRGDVSHPDSDASRTADLALWALSST
jgi:hypothetical protein